MQKRTDVLRNLVSWMENQLDATVAYFAKTLVEICSPPLRKTNEKLKTTSRRGETPYVMKFGQGTSSFDASRSSPTTLFGKLSMSQ
jgi:hypothetical protein